MRHDEPSERPDGANCSGETGESGKANPGRLESESWRGVVDLRHWRESRGKVGEESGNEGLVLSSNPSRLPTDAPWPFEGLSPSDVWALSAQDRAFLEASLILVLEGFSLRGARKAVDTSSRCLTSDNPTPAPPSGDTMGAQKTREKDPAAVAQCCAAGSLALVQKSGAGVGCWWECLGSREHLLRLGLCEPGFFPEGRKRLAHEWINEDSWREVWRLRGGVWRFRTGGTVEWRRRVAAAIQPRGAVARRPALRLVLAGDIGAASA